MCTNPISVPVKIAGKVVGTQVVGCGHCHECLSGLALDFMQRVYLESLSMRSIHFVTLTYDDESLPFRFEKRSVLQSYDDPLHRCQVVKDVLVCPSLRRSDVVRQLKLFRASLKYDFSYSFIGEYGKKGRPHYHGLLFGLQDADVNRFCKAFWPFGYSLSKPIPLAGSAHSDIAAVGLYVAKYLRKGSFEKQEVFDGLCEEPRPFSSLGLGKSAIPRLRRWYLALDDFPGVDINDDHFPPGYVDCVERRLERFPIADKVYPVSKYLRHEFLYYSFTDPFSGKVRKRASRLSKILADRLSLRIDGRAEKEFQELAIIQNEDLRLAQIKASIRANTSVLSGREARAKSLHKSSLVKSRL